MKQSLFKITENKPLTESVYKMTLSGDTSDIKAPGQFVNIKLDGLYLRRPISVCDCEDGTLTLIYKVVGKGTEQMAEMKEGSLDILTGLGNGKVRRYAAFNRRWSWCSAPLYACEKAHIRREKSNSYTRF